MGRGSACDHPECWDHCKRKEAMTTSQSEPKGTCDYYGFPHPEADHRGVYFRCINWQPLSPGTAPDEPTTAPNEPTTEYHGFCTQERTDHNCSCHINPPCASCMECPVWDDDTAPDEPSEPTTDQLVRVIESLFRRSERERLWRDNLSDEQTHSKSFSDGMICGLAIATGELTPLAESLARVLATPTDENPTSEGEKE